MTTWQRVEVAHPAFRLMRYDRRTKRRRDWPYIEIGGVAYRVRRVVADNVAWVTEVTNPIEKFAVVMKPAETPLLKHFGYSTEGKITWSRHGDDGRSRAGTSSRRPVASATPISPPQRTRGR